MEIIDIASTRTTPHIYFDPEKGSLILEGRSLTNDAIAFYTPIITALQVHKTAKNISVTFNVEYFNTSSFKSFQMLFERLSELKNQGYAIHVDWHSKNDDIDLIEAGEDMSEHCSLAFNYILI